MQIRIAEDQEGELKALAELMKDSTNEKEPDEDEETAQMIWKTIIPDMPSSFRPIISYI